MTTIHLKNGHLLLPKALVNRIFGEIHYAYVSYVPDNGELLITPVSSQWFVKIHEPAQFLLKSRNLKGDKSLAIREILIDNNVNEIDRQLKFEIVEKTQLIKIKMD